MKSRVLALSAITAGVIAICLILGSFLSVMDITLTVLTSIVIMLPLYLKSYLGAFLSYLAGGLIALIFTAQFLGVSFVLPSYALFFGIYPIVKTLLQQKNVNKVLTFIIGAIWCVLFFYGLYFYYTLIMGLSFTGIPQFIINNVLFFIAPFGLVFYIIYDKFVAVGKLFLDKYLPKIIKK